MKKRVLCVAVICAMLLCTAAYARPDDSVFDTGKRAMALISYGEYSRAMEKLNMSQISAEDFAADMESKFTALYRGTVQTDVAVLFSESGSWYLAIPVSAPTDDRVETMVFSLNDTDAFVQIGAALWGDVSARVDKSDDVIWNQEYRRAAPILEPDT